MHASTLGLHFVSCQGEKARTVITVSTDKIKCVVSVERLKSWNCRGTLHSLPSESMDTWTGIFSLTCVHQMMKAKEHQCLFKYYVSINISHILIQNHLTEMYWMIVSYIVNRNAQYSSRDSDGREWEIWNENHAFSIDICCIRTHNICQRLQPAHHKTFFQSWQYSVSDIYNIKICWKDTKY
jgi:hypothetical protein